MNISRRLSATYSLCIVLLLLTNGVILWKHTRLRKEFSLNKSAGVNARGIEALMSRPLLASNGDYITLARVESQYVVLFVFTPADCATCLEELASLERIGQIRNDTKVYGLMGYSSPDELQQTQQNFGFSFPILQDPSGQILNSLALPKRPWKVVVRVPSKEVIYEDHPSLTEAEREAFVNRIARLTSQ